MVSGVNSEGAKGGGSPLWWVVAAIAVVVSVGLVVWLLVTSPPPAPTPTPATPSPSAAASPTATPSQPETTVSEFDYGEFPPTYELKDLSDPDFPQEVAGFELESLDEGAGFVATDFWREPGVAPVSAWLYEGRLDYPSTVADWLEPDFHGRALCGQPVSHPQQIECVMAGKFQTLSVGARTGELTLEEAAAFTEALYDAL